MRLRPGSTTATATFELECAFKCLLLLSMAKIKIKLDIEPDPEVTVIGISCHEHDYRLCWAMNHAMELEFTRRREDIIESGLEARFGVFDHIVDPDRGGYMLINNHCEHGVLIADQKNADYFLVVDNEVAEDVPDLMERIRDAEFVLAAFKLQFDQLRNGHKLLR